ncbi:MAG: hypothetical protein ACRDWB_07990, partial [Acidimicrobiales bacterium]
AGPGDPLDDVAAAAWWWVPLVHPELAAKIGAPDIHTQPRRLEVFLSAYGYSNVSGFLARVLDLVKARSLRAETGVAAGDPAFVNLRLRGYLQELAATTEHLGAGLT